MHGPQYERGEPSRGSRAVKCQRGILCWGSWRPLVEVPVEISYYTRQIQLTKSERKPSGAFAPAASDPQITQL